MNKNICAYRRLLLEMGLRKVRVELSAMQNAHTHTHRRSTEAEIVMDMVQMSGTVKKTMQSFHTNNQR